MSVMQELKSLAGQEGTSSMPKFSKGGAKSKDMQELDQTLMAHPIPGQSLTQDPESKLPYETPPEFTNIQEFIDESFLRFTDEEKLPDLLDAMRTGLPVDYIAEKYLSNSMQKGEITPDLVLLAAEPTIYMLIAVATYADIEPVLYPEDDMNDASVSEQTSMYKQAALDLRVEEAQEDGKLTVEELQRPTNVSNSLLSRTKQAVSNVTQGEGQ